MISIGMAECPHCLDHRWIIVAGANVCAGCGRRFELKPASEATDRVRRREELLAPVLAAGGPEAGWESVGLAGEEDPPPRSSWQPDSEWRRGEPAAGSYSHHETESRRGAEWALGVMPLLMLAVQYGVTFALIKVLGLSTALFGSLSALGIACTIVGLVIVYRGTGDIGLTVGYVVVRWIESFFVGLSLAPLCSPRWACGPAPRRPLREPRRERRRLAPRQDPREPPQRRPARQLSRST